MTFDSIVPWGRSLAEYRLMFGLSDNDLIGNIFSYGDGPASFNSEMTAAGRRVTSSDPIYACSKAEIHQRVEHSYIQSIYQLKQDDEPYAWDYFRDLNQLGENGLETMTRFLDDFDAGIAAKRYVPEQLPHLSFPDRHFQLALSSHYLFFKPEQFTLEFHVEAIQELLRVAEEVRIFPVLDVECKRCPYVGFVWTIFTDKGFSVELKNVDYEFQQGGNQMMRIRRNGATQS
jgi:hypothetical protein